jgi:hypothetical protein
VRIHTVIAAAGLSLAAGAVLLAQTPFLGLKILPNGNVGIGTLTPQATLHVNGDTLVSGAIKGDNYQGRYRDAAVIDALVSSGSGTAPMVIVYNDTQPAAQIMLVNTATNVFKNFVIAHPTDPARYLVHATLEGPEGAVYYRGSAQLTRGRAEVALPHYFESLTRRDGRTIQLTNVDGFDPLAIHTQDGEQIRNGRFVVVSNVAGSTQRFDWEVKAVRADGPPLDAEPLKSDTTVGGFGPYTFVRPRPASQSPARGTR